jgi:hypothetical protein
VLSFAGCQRQPEQHQTSAAEKLQLSRTCGDDAEKFRKRKDDAGDMNPATWPYTSHYNAEQGRCFIEISANWTETSNPWRNHDLRIVYNAIEGNEIAKMETVTWFDMPAKPDATPHELFRFGGDEVPASSERLTYFRGLMKK